MKNYEAPWSTSLVIVSFSATLICLGASFAMMRSTHGVVPLLALMPLAIVCGSALFTIRGYIVTEDAILIERLFWKTRLPLAGLKSAKFDPEAMRRSLRTFGNGGLFSFTGLFYNSALGSYRAFVTDPRRTVVLEFPARRIVVSPAEPEQFVEQLGIASRDGRR